MLLHYILLFEIVKKLMAMTVREQIEMVENCMDQQHSIYDYLLSVWLPELMRQPDLDAVVKVEETEYTKNVEAFLVRLNMKGVEDAKPFVE